MTQTTKPRRRCIASNWALLSPIFVLLLALALLGVYGGWFPSANEFLRRSLNLRDVPAWGQLGDYFGGIMNPIIAFFTLITAIRVWSLTRETLKLQKQDRKETLLFHIVDHIRGIESLFEIQEKEKSFHVVPPEHFSGMKAIRRLLALIQEHGINGIADFDTFAEHQGATNSINSLCRAFETLAKRIDKQWSNRAEREEYFQLCLALLAPETFEIAKYWANHSRNANDNFLRERFKSLDLN